MDSTKQCGLGIHEEGGTESAKMQWECPRGEKRRNVLKRKFSDTTWTDAQKDSEEWYVHNE